MVHTDIPANDFSSLFETIEDDPDTYLTLNGVYALAAGRSFYGRIFPPESLTLAWSAIAVHWISRVPMPIHGHVYSPFATGEVRDAFREQSAADWRIFLESRAAEMRPGAEMLVVGGANRDDGQSGAEPLMNALDAAIREEVSAGALTREEYDHMSIPTWNRTLAEFTAPLDRADRGGAVGLRLLESDLAFAPDAYLAAYREDHDAHQFGAAVSGFLPRLHRAQPVRRPHAHARGQDRDRRPRVRPGRGGGDCRPRGDGDTVARGGAADRQAGLGGRGG